LQEKCVYSAFGKSALGRKHGLVFAQINKNYMLSQRAEPAQLANLWS